MATSFFVHEYGIASQTNVVPVINLCQDSKASQTQLSIDFDNTNDILQTQPEEFITLFPLRGSQSSSIHLKKSSLGRSIKTNQVFYHGYLVNQPSSLVAITIDKSGISGMLSDPTGNYTIQTTGSSISSVRQDQRVTKQWTCSSEEMYDDKSIYSGKSIQSTQSDTLFVYFVCDYALFNMFGRSVTATRNHVYSLFHQVQAIYSNENISIGISDVFIWTQPDPYDKSNQDQALLSFRNIVGEGYQGDFAHLLSGVSSLSGGVAFINGLCNRSKSFGYSNLEGSVSQPGQYSWDVHVVAHELGHNLGSPHTHECLWGPNLNAPIDGCASPSGSCQNGPIPSGGGTIMSYCHLNSVGVNFSHGFGPEPGDLIREIVDLCQPGNGESCENAITLSESGIYYTGDINSGNGASHSDAIHAKWYRFQAEIGGELSIFSCNQNVDTRLYIHNGDCSSLSSNSFSDDDCLSGDGFNYASEIMGLYLDAGASVFIEWDDRWMSNGFDFTFDFSPDQGTCNNNVKDGDETGVDCGGSCPPLSRSMFRKLINTRSSQRHPFFFITGRDQLQWPHRTTWDADTE